MSANIDQATVAGFGQEWSAFDQSGLREGEHREQFERYFAVFPFDALPPDAEGFDMGCGSGRWAMLMAERVGLLHCVDPAPGALAVAKRRLAHLPNVRFHLASSETMPIPDGSQDFGYSLGVLHHIPDTEAAMRDCVRKLKPGAPLLVYLYYRFDHRPSWFRAIWRVSDAFRRTISRMPFRLRKGVTTAIAATVYWPLARTAGALEALGANVTHIPLASYRHHSFYTMATDSLDRFGTRLEQRFLLSEIVAMMGRCGLVDIRASDREPHWVVCGRRAAAAERPGASGR